MKSLKSKFKAFTLIELLIVIVIIGILAVALIPRLTWSQGMARDKARMADLKQIQTALEFYASEHGGKYPSTLPSTAFPVVNPGYYRWNCSYWWSYGTSWSGGYIPDLAPDYISSLPLDPKPKWTRNCYLYSSNWKGYMFLIYQTVEGKVPDEFKRPAYQNEKNYAIYTSDYTYR